jgi:cytoskeleton protein RodZ
MGIGSALRKARLLRGKSLQEVSRETRIRAEYLEALERERFEDLLGDVYVRGFLRSYASYLGLDPARVFAVYNRRFGEPRPSLPRPRPAPARSIRPSHPHLSPGPVRHHPSWALLAGVAVSVMALLGVAGILSRNRSAPPAEALGHSQVVAPSPYRPVTVVLRARGRVTATVWVDGGRASVFSLRPGEGRSFQGQRSIAIHLDPGGVTAVSVNGHDLGRPGDATEPYQATFRPIDFRAGRGAAP